MAFRSLMILLCVGARYTANAAQNGVLTTHHGATEHGACMLPEASYIVTKPVALGDIGSLGPLKYKTGMCGKILRVDCGNGPLDVIVSNSNLGGGLDLYKSSWNQATRNAQPGQKWCRVELTNHNAIHGHGPRCYYEPSSEKNNQWYKLLGLFNTGNKIVVSASLDGKPASFNGVQPYLAFHGGPVSPNASIKFNFQDGSSHTVKLRDCIKQNRAKTWS